LQKNTFPFQNFHGEKIKSLLIKKQVSNYYANTSFLKFVGHSYGGRESYLI